MAIPLYGFLEGDTIGLLVIAEEGERIQELAQKLCASASIRVTQKSDFQLIHDGKAIEPGITVKQSGLQALDRFDVIWRSAP